MSTTRLTFHHLGMAVLRPEKAHNSLRTLGYQIGKEVYDDEQKVYVQMCSSAAFPAIELVHSESDDGPIAVFTELQDETIYHICFETDSIDDTVNEWRAAGIRMIRIKAKTPAPLFERRNVAFYQVEGMGVVELLESQPAAASAVAS